MITAAVVGTAAGAVAAGGVTIHRRRRGGGDDSRRPWSCSCGQAYLLSGVDRHRVYWLPDAPPSDPLLARECVACGAELPADHEAAVV